MMKMEEDGKKGETNKNTKIGNNFFLTKTPNHAKKYVHHGKSPLF